MSKLINAWLHAKVQSAIAKTHDEPVTLLVADWTSLMIHFMKQYGDDILDEKLPAQSSFEAFEEKLADGYMTAETLAHVVSLAGTASKP